jgi:CheY-like chemotaxis protein
MQLIWLWLMLAALPVVLVAVAMKKRAARRRAREQVAQQMLAAAAAEAALIMARRRNEVESKARIAAEALQRASREAAETLARQKAAARIEPPAAPVVPVAAPPRKTREQLVVMVADDSKIVRVKTSRLLVQHRYQVCLAEDGLDAARQIAARMPDVLITDVEMPGMDGFELTRRLRENPATAHIPIIMITAADAQHRDNAARAGVNALLGKPYPDAELVARIEALLGLERVDQREPELLAS